MLLIMEVELLLNLSSQLWLTDDKDARYEMSNDPDFLNPLLPAVDNKQ